LRLTLNGVLWAAIVGLAAVLGASYYLINRSSEEAVETSTRQLRENAISQSVLGVESYLKAGTTVVERLAQQLKAGECAVAESCLMAELLGNPNLAEVTLTQGTDVGFDEEGFTLLAPEGRRLTTVFRTSGDKAEVCTRTVAKEGPGYVARTRCRAPHQVMGSPGPEKTGDALDPTTSGFGFIRPASEHFRGRTLMSDLSHSQLDDVLPENERRVVLVAIHAVEDDQKKLLGAFKVGLHEKQMRQEVKNQRVNRGDPQDPFRIFIADDLGRLITGLEEDDKLVDYDDDLRVKPRAMPPAVQQALEHPKLKEVSEEQPAADGNFALDGHTYNASYRFIKDSRDWRLVIVGPDDYYLKTLKDQQRTMLLGMLGAFGLLFLGGVITVRVIRRALSQVQREAKGMTDFNFAAATVRSPFADIRETLFSLEQAKTAVRAMGKYVPLELVRKLFAENREPSLGGSLREVTIFFSDIEGFTTRAEEEPPDVVAQWLGRYLEVMTTAVHAEEGTVDKFIGDAVMALWNAPRASADHAVLACRAALRCQRETKKLYASADWGRPPLVTRIGLHVGAVMVGHFGAPDRLSYTAIGDSVNLASRLEGLNKVYGTTVLVSDEVHLRAREKFAFRRLDLVAVKGKSHAIAVYELLGDVGAETEQTRRYEQALELYIAGDFAKARALLLLNPSDPPSKVLAARCGELERNPPAAPWAGITFAQSK
jgi:adenylate cyclase